MIETVAAGVMIADKVVKKTNEIKKKEMGKRPDEIDELDLLHGALSIAEVATTAGAEKVASDCIEGDETQELLDEIGENSEVSVTKESVNLPDEIEESDLVETIPVNDVDAEPVQNESQLTNAEDGTISSSEVELQGNDTEKDTIKKSDELDEDLDDAEPKKGGSYRDVKKTSDGETHEVHHMPANSVTNLELDDGPAIKMEKEDHRQTASWGSSREAREYREQQRELIEQGKFREALQMDIDDLHDKFGDKYDDAIAEMMEYVDKLELEGIL